MLLKSSSFMARQNFLFIVLWILSSALSAQVIDDSSIEKNQNGNYNFVEGQFVAYLSDTVSPTFIHNQFQNLGISILEVTIEPLLIALVNRPTRERLEEMELHQHIIGIFQTSLTKERKNLEFKLSDPTLNAQQKKAIRQLLSMPQEDYVIEFDYSVDVKKAKRVMGEFRDVAYKIFRNSLRTVTLEAEPGNEPLLMDKIEQLPFVESTAMIGTVK